MSYVVVEQILVISRSCRADLCDVTGRGYVVVEQICVI